MDKNSEILNKLFLMLEEKFSCLDENNHNIFVVNKIVLDENNEINLLFKISDEFPVFVDLLFTGSSEKFNYSIDVVNKIKIGYSGETEAKTKGKYKAIKNLINNAETLSFLLEKIIKIVCPNKSPERIHCVINGQTFHINFCKRLDRFSSFSIRGSLSNKSEPVAIYYFLESNSFQRNFYIKFTDFEQINTYEELEEAYMKYYRSKNNAITKNEKKSTGNS